MVLWPLPQASKDCLYGLKYRLYYGLADRTCVVRYDVGRYDNATGKGDRRHGSVCFNECAEADQRRQSSQTQ